MAHVIVTGSSRGIGFELVKNLAGQGHQVLALSRNEKPVKELSLEGVHTFPFDLASENDLKQLSEYLEKNPPVDVLVHNAGLLKNKPFAETSLEDFREVYEVNVFGVATLTKAVLPYFNSGAHVLTISSMGGIQGSAKFPGLSAYSSSKGAVITLTELLAEEFKESGPSFNALALGAVQTEMLEEAFPGYQAPVSAAQMAAYIGQFALTGHSLYNGKVLQVSNSTP